MSDSESRFLDALYRGVADDREIKRALEILQSMFRCQSGTFLSLDATAPSADIATTAGLFDEYVRLYMEQFASLDPAPAIFTRLPPGTASTTDRIMSPELRRKDTFNNEFFLPIGLTETLGGTLFSNQARFSLIGLQRGDDRPSFDDGEILQLERLMPHIARALQLRRAFFSMSKELAELRSAIDRLPTGILLFGPGGNVTFVNAAVRAIAQRSDGLSIDRNGRPRLLSMEARQRLEALLDNVTKGGAGGICPVPRANGVSSYVLLVAPTPPSWVGAEWQANRSAGAIVLVHDPEARTRDATEILQAGLNLPRAAARLVASLAADDDLKSFAEREGVTIHTARFHLRTALGKTGTRTQAELVRAAVRLLRDLALKQD